MRVSKADSSQTLDLQRDALPRGVGFLYTFWRRRHRRPRPRSPEPRSAREAGSGTPDGGSVETEVSNSSPVTACTATPNRVWPAGASHRHRSVPATEPPGKLQLFVITPPS